MDVAAYFKAIIEDAMPIPTEQIVAGHCYRSSDKELRKVLIRQGRRVTYVIRGIYAFTVLRCYVDVEDFASAIDSEIDCVTLHDIAADAVTA
jgi:hypothetical protein